VFSTQLNDLFVDWVRLNMCFASRFKFVDGLLHARRKWNLDLRLRFRMRLDMRWNEFVDVDGLHFRLSSVLPNPCGDGYLVVFARNEGDVILRTIQFEEVFQNLITVVVLHQQGGKRSTVLKDSSRVCEEGARGSQQILFSNFAILFFIIKTQMDTYGTA